MNEEKFIEMEKIMKDLGKFYIYIYTVDSRYLEFHWTLEKI